MKIVVFGASGGTGRHVIEQALAQGHLVTAFVRAAPAPGHGHPNLETVEGDVLDPASVESAIPGHEAVLVALGAPPRKSGVRAEGTRNVVRAMEKAGVRRLVCQASLGYGDTRKVLDLSPVYFKYLVVPLLLRKVFADHERQEEVVRQSGLDWIIVRPGNLTHGPRTGVYKHGFPSTDKTIKVSVSRADVADFMLRQLSSDTYLRKTPGLSY